MTDEDLEEIRNIVREEYQQIIKNASLTDNDIIIKEDQYLSKQETAQHEFTSFDGLKKIGNLVIMVGKKGLEVVGIVVLLGNIIQFGSVLVFEKEWLNAVDLAHRARQGVIELASNIRKQEPDTPETLIVTSPTWDKLNDVQYRILASDYLSGKSPIEELYNPNTQFIATTGTSIETINSTSSDSKDFEV